jgi:hypothetical protein
LHRLPHESDEDYQARWREFESLIKHRQSQDVGVVLSERPITTRSSGANRSDGDGWRGERRSA